MSSFGFFVPVMGLQRFYVGKVRTGLLWLFTFGLFGLGQIYDTILIALGHFKDADGNRVLNFTRERVNSELDAELGALKQPVNDYSNVVRRRWTDSRVGFKLGNLLSNLIGAILLLIALGAGAVAVIDIPQGMAAGAFGAEVQRDLAHGWGMPDWNVFVTGAFGMVSLITGMLAAICLIFARRESTWRHMLRIPIAALLFVASISAVGNISLNGRRWHYIAEYALSEEWGEAFQHFMGNFWPGAITGSLCFVAAVFVLGWPARRERIEVVEERRVHAATNEERSKQTV